MSSRAKLLGMVCLTGLFVVGCSGSDGDTDVNVGGGEGAWNVGGVGDGGTGSVGGGSDGGGSTPTESDTVVSQSLDCSTLDPDSVYFYGTMRWADENLSVDFGPRALAVPDSPLTFCAAFGQDAIFVDDNVQIVVSPSGDALYSEQVNGDIYRMSPDEISVSSLDLFNSIALETMLANDTLISTNPDDDLPERLVADPTNDGEVFYQGESSLDPIISSASGGVYYTPAPGMTLMGALEDGSLLLFNLFQGVIHLSPTLVETVLVAPVAGPYEDVDARTKIAPDGTVWFVVALDGDEDNLMRWRLDPADNSIINEGGFAAVPADITPFASAIPLLDGDGNLWQSSNLSDGDDNYFGAIRRPIASSAEASVGFHVTGFPEGASVISSYLATGP